MAFPAAPPDSENIYGGGISSIKVGGTSGINVGFTRGGVEIARSFSEFLSEVDQNTAHLDARAIMVEMFIRTTLAEGVLTNVAYAWNIPQSSVNSSSSLRVEDSADEENAIAVVGPGPSLTTATFHAYRTFAQGSMTFRWARDADVGIPVEWRILYDTDKSPARFADWYIN